MKDCLVSYLMTVYNDENHLKQAIESILNQTWMNLELVIVNDGSTDGSREILNSIEDSRCKVIHRDENKGRVYSLNEGLKHCQSNYIFINDSDDIALAHRTSSMMNYLEDIDDHWGLVASSSLTVKNGNKKAYYLRKNMFFHVKRGKISKLMLYIMNPFVHSTVVYNKCALERIGGFASEVSGMIDYLTYLKLSRYYNLYGMSDILEERTVHETNYFEMHMKNEEKEKNREIVYRWIKNNVTLGSLFVLLNRFVNLTLSKWIRRMKSVQ